MQLRPRFNRRFHRSAAGGDLEVGPFDLHCNGPAKTIRFFAPGPNIVSHRDHARFDPSGIVKSSEKVVSDPEDFRSRSD